MGKDDELTRGIVPGNLAVVAADSGEGRDNGTSLTPTDLASLMDNDSSAFGDPQVISWLQAFAAEEYPYVDEPFQTIAIHSLMAVRNLPDQGIHELAYDLDEEVIQNSQSGGYGNFVMRGPALSDTLADLRAPTDGGIFLKPAEIIAKFRESVAVRLAQTRSAQAFVLRGQRPETNVVTMNHVRNFTNKAIAAQALTRKAIA